MCTADLMTNSLTETNKRNRRAGVTNDGGFSRYLLSVDQSDLITNLRTAPDSPGRRVSSLGFGHSNEGQKEENETGKLWKGRRVSFHNVIFSDSISDDSAPPSDHNSRDKELLQKSEVESRKISLNATQPKGTLEYRVLQTDTLPKIAALYNTTPTELMAINRLMTYLLCPGQILHIPDRTANATEVAPALQATAPGAPTFSERAPDRRSKSDTTNLRFPVSELNSNHDQIIQNCEIGKAERMDTRGMERLEPASKDRSASDPFDPLSISPEVKAATIAAWQNIDDDALPITSAKSDGKKPPTQSVFSSFKNGLLKPWNRRKSHAGVLTESIVPATDADMDENWLTKVKHSSPMKPKGNRMTRQRSVSTTACPQSHQLMVATLEKNNQQVPSIQITGSEENQENEQSGQNPENDRLPLAARFRSSSMSKTATSATHSTHDKEVTPEKPEKKRRTSHAGFHHIKDTKLWPWSKASSQKTTQQHLTADSNSIKNKEPSSEDVQSMLGRTKPGYSRQRSTSLTVCPDLTKFQANEKEKRSRKISMFGRAAPKHELSDEVTAEKRKPRLFESNADFINESKIASHGVCRMTSHKLVFESVGASDKDHYLYWHLWLETFDNIAIYEGKGDLKLLSWSEIRDELKLYQPAEMPSSPGAYPDHDIGYLEMFYQNEQALAEIPEISSDSATSSQKDLLPGSMDSVASETDKDGKITAAKFPKTLVPIPIYSVNRVDIPMEVENSAENLTEGENPVNFPTEAMEHIVSQVESHSICDRVRNKESEDIRTGIVDSTGGSECSVVLESQTSEKVRTYYLCLTCNSSECSSSFLIPPTTTTSSESNQPNKSGQVEYWLIIPRENVLELHAFLASWFPDSFANNNRLQEFNQTDPKKPESHYNLAVMLKDGCDLLECDGEGSSNPYVKFKSNKKLLYKSRPVYKNVNPRWAETFRISKVDPSGCIDVKVAHYDRLRMDRFMGEGSIRINQLEIDKSTEIKIFLSDDKGRTSQSSKYLGFLSLDCRLSQKISLNLLQESTFPTLSQTSLILTHSHIRMLRDNLPAAMSVSVAWTLGYSSDVHGSSINTLYRQMADQDKNAPTFLVIIDSNGEVFGALLSCSIRLSEGFYGNGECFLFTFQPRFQKFKWSGENLFFAKGSKDCISIGAGKGVHGLWLNEDLYHGRTDSCETFANKPLTPSKDFTIKVIEIWVLS